MDVSHSFLLLLVLGNFLRSNDRRQLVYLVRILRLFVAQVLIKGSHGMLLKLLHIGCLRWSSGATCDCLSAEAGGDRLLLSSLRAATKRLDPLLRHEVFVNVGGDTLSLIARWSSDSPCLLCDRSRFTNACFDELS